MPLAFTDQQMATIQDIARALSPPHLRPRYLERKHTVKTAARTVATLGFIVG
jgi:hypothetical protein